MSLIQKPDRKIVNFAIIGYGRVVEKYHRQLVEATPGAYLLAVQDITKSRREAARVDGVPRVYSSLDELFKDKDVHAVSITTPPHTHLEIAVKAAKAGKHIICEKPAALSFADYKKMMAAIEDAKVVFTVFHNRRFDPDYMVANEIIQNKMVGDLISIEKRHQRYNSLANWGVEDFNPAWRVLKDFGGGVLYDMGPHVLDQIGNISIGEPESVFAQARGGVREGDCDDWFLGIIRFNGVATVLVEVGNIIRIHIPHWRILGTKGIAYGDEETRTFELYIGDSSVPAEKIQYNELNKNFIGDWGRIYSSFVDVIQNRSKSLAVPPETVVTTMKLLDAFRESISTGRSVTLG